MVRRTAVVVAVVGVSILAVPNAAKAAPAENGTLVRIRRNLEMTITLGGGAILTDCDDCLDFRGVALGFHVGMPVARRVAVGLSTGGVASVEHGRTLLSSVFALGPRFALTDRLDLTVGAGLALGSGVVGPVFEREDAFGLLGAAAFSLWNLSDRHRLQLELRASRSYFELVTITNFAVSLGVSWSGRARRPTTER